jgi:hypothetical protein
VTAVGVYVLVVDCNPLAAGDTLELRLYLKTLSGSTSRVAYKVGYSGAQSADDMVKLSVPIVVTHQLDATLKQTAGVARSFDWELRAL